MKKISQGLTELFSTLGESDADRIARRTAIVHVRWKEAIRHVYKDAAQLVLDHINSVVIMDDNGARTLIVYADDSLIRSDLDSRQEFIKMKLKEQGETLDVFRILPSRFDMKARHPFKETEEEQQEAAMLRRFSQKNSSKKNQATNGSKKSGGTGKNKSNDEGVSEIDEDYLSLEKREELEKKAEIIENPLVRRAFINALNADFEEKKYN